MTVKELYRVYINFDDSSWFNVYRGNENIDCVFMEDLIKCYGEKTVEWVEYCKNNMYNIGVRL